MVEVALPWCATLSKSASGCSSAIWRSDRFSASPQQRGCLPVGQLHHQRFVGAPRGQVRRLWREDAHTQCSRLLNQNFHSGSDGSASHNSPGPKLASMAAAPPMYSACACVMATASRRLMPRDHRYGDTTSSPISKSECAQGGRPPASTSRVRPLGDTKQNRVSLAYVNRCHLQCCGTDLRTRRDHSNPKRTCGQRGQSTCSQPDSRGWLSPRGRC